MFPYPLHPAIVHFPIALFILAPIVALGSLWAIRKGARPVRAWGLTLAVLGALFITTWLAVETGENDEDVVERVVPRDAVHEHEEIAETFLLLTGVVLVVSAAGLVPVPAVARTARILGTVGTFVLVVIGWKVGHTGGDLVYKHGAASAFTELAAVKTSDASMNTEGASTVAHRRGDLP